VCLFVRENGPSCLYVDFLWMSRVRVTSQWPSPHPQANGQLRTDHVKEEETWKKMRVLSSRVFQQKKEWRKRNKKKKPFFLEEDFRFLRSDSKEIFAGNKIREWGT